MMMDLEEVNTSSRWVKLLYYLWKIFTCLFLHVLLITIVVSYCFFGMYMFKKLEEDYEKDMKKNITSIRRSISTDIWKYTAEQKVLHRANWSVDVRSHLRRFEESLVWAMRKGGWNGNDNETALQWTSDGALFYSVIVITTIELINPRKRRIEMDVYLLVVKKTISTVSLDVHVAEKYSMIPTNSFKFNR